MEYTRLLFNRGKPYLEGADVRAVQEALKKDGFSLAIDGKYGPQTAWTVEAYQLKHKLKKDGIVGPQTWGHMFTPKPAADPETVRLNDSGEDVSLLQSMLNHFGFNCGNVDGRFGGKTDAALRLFQRKMKLTINGVCDSKVWGVITAPSLERFKQWGFLVLLHERDYPFMVRQFQAGMSLKPDAIVGPLTLGALAKDIIVPRFGEVDMKCQCNGKYCGGFPAGQVAQGVLLFAERMMRETLKTYPKAVFYITNRKTPAPNGAIAGGHRCTRWNSIRGGASGSRHRKGIAVDIGCNDSKARLQLEKHALALNKYGGVGYGARYIVHMDLGGKRRWRY